MIVGFYLDPTGVHDYIRAHDGSFTSFDAPSGFFPAFQLSINPAGVIVGWYQDENLITHGFIRLLNRSFVPFDAVNPPFVTFPAGVTSADVVAGSCQRPSQPFGFVRARDGSITLFNPPSSILTVVTGINDARQVTGWYDDVGFLQHAFIRLPWQPQLANATN